MRIKDAEASNGLSLSRAITAAGELVNEQNELITEGVEKGKYRAWWSEMNCKLYRPVCK